MVLTFLPLFTASVFHHVLINRAVLGDFQDIARRQRDELMPAQHLEVSLWEATVPLDLYLLNGDPAQPAAYRRLREQIESGFARLHTALEKEPEARDLVARARADWTAADQAAGRILSLRSARDADVGERLAKEVDAVIASALDKLAAAHHELERGIDADHIDAARSAERADWIAGIAAGVSLCSMAIGVFVIGYRLSRSIDRLVEGAERFAAGERDHRIEVHVPPELHRVAEEFNYMIGRIRESETSLADLARRDRLTGLLNRRALDEMLADALGRRGRLGEDIAVALIDVDFFKRVNDTQGHAAGDEVLRLIGARVSAEVQEVDRVFRFGGEEFVVLLRNATRASAHAVAERVRLSIASQPLSVHGIDVPITISAGLAMAASGSDAEGLLGAADAALYRAKSAGRNCVEWAA
jgi:diguanylate cyclase (GGDEF)-like protein